MHREFIRTAASDQQDSTDVLRLKAERGDPDPMLASARHRTSPRQPFGTNGQPSKATREHSSVSASCTGTAVGSHRTSFGLTCGSISLPLLHKLEPVASAI